ncbi:hypothetical protein BKA61DRAFT_257921 [Leptodontidium sp. MPI-SDFR-AT-0119]|nr:hypothetical protein BKA61DRAFT_257921 [Leptodontidium sp. MPI-SDFR-AT-0119]
MCMRPTILSYCWSLVSFLPQQHQQTIINLHHHARFVSQILYRFKKAQIPHFWSLEICGVDSTPLTRLAPSPVHFLRHLYNFSSTTLVHNQPQIPSQPKALIEIMFLSCSRSTELLHYIYSATNKSQPPNDIKHPPQKTSAPHPVVAAIFKICILAN